MDALRDSIRTSVKTKVFSSVKTSSYSHIFESKLVDFQVSKCRNLHNFNPDRLSKDPYPKEDRPRGQDDLDSVLHHRRTIRREGETEPIWIAKKGDRYIILDGVHRIVATNMENKRQIPAFIVNIE